MAQDDKKAAFAGVIASAAAATTPDDGAQLDLLAPPTRPTLSASEQERVAAAIKHDRAGRPPGARNKVTREMLDFLRKYCGDPMERRFRYAQHTPETLAIELGCSKLEAFQILDRLWADLSAYFYGKQAPVDSAGAPVAPRLTMVIGGQNAVQIGPDGTVRPPWEYIDATNAETQQNQALPAPADPVSHAAVSHDPE